MKTDKNGMLDKNGQKINVGDTVDVDSPDSTDTHQNAFQGQVMKIYESIQSVCVRDQEDDYFAVPAQKVTVV